MSFDFKKDALENFLDLLKEAQVKGIPEANAMSLATVNSSGQPSVRIVYYKGLLRGGFSFYTNYEGRKAQDIAANPHVSLNFFWPHLDRQVRVEGVASKSTREESEKYFATRARLSQLGAWSSHQSKELESFEAFQKKLNEVEQRFEGVAVPCPSHWGGYRVEPTELEFWFGKTARLHERYLYKKVNNEWVKFLRNP